MEEKTNEQTVNNIETKFCQECGARIAKKAVFCPNCGCQVENIEQAKTQIVVNNSNQTAQNTTVTVPQGFRMCNKWVAVLLCLFLGFVGGHKFYEGKIIGAILYIFTFGFFGIGVLIDLLTLLGKPNPYAVY